MANHHDVRYDPNPRLPGPQQSHRYTNQGIRGLTNLRHPPFVPCATSKCQRRIATFSASIFQFGPQACSPYQVALDDPDGQNPELVQALVAVGAAIRAVEANTHSLEEVYLELLGSSRGQERTLSAAGVILRWPRLWSCSKRRYARFSSSEA
jgi:hypothetical protein